MNDTNGIRCKACSIRQTIPSVPESLTESIWAFPFFSYVTEKEMGDAFYRFVQENPYNSSYNSHNEEGYTFTQWQIYYLSKNRHDCKPLHRSVLHLFHVLSAYPFFRDMIRLGSVRDPVHHTLHHFTKYMDRVSYQQNEMLTLLTHNGLSLEDEDSEGMTPQDYLSNIRLHPQDLRRANVLTRLYKERERVLFETISVRRCESCNDPVAPYDDLSHAKPDRSQLQEILKFREECVDIYRAYNCSSVARHQYIIDRYKSLM